MLTAGQLLPTQELLPTTKTRQPAAAKAGAGCLGSLVKFARLEGRTYQDNKGARFDI